MQRVSSLLSIGTTLCALFSSSTIFNFFSFVETAAAVESIELPLCCQLICFIYFILFCLTTFSETFFSTDNNVCTLCFCLCHRYINNLNRNFIVCGILLFFIFSVSFVRSVFVSIMCFSFKCLA